MCSSDLLSRMSRSVGFGRRGPEVLGRVGSSPMRKLLYLPFAIVGSVLARILGRQVFRTVWERIDQEPPPAPGEGRGSAAKVVPSWKGYRPEPGMEYHP